jgi:hypothetical protein
MGNDNNNNYLDSPQKISQRIPFKSTDLIGRRGDSVYIRYNIGAAACRYYIITCSYRYNIMQLRAPTGFDILQFSSFDLYIMHHAFRITSPKRNPVIATCLAYIVLSLD